MIQYLGHREHIVTWITLNVCFYIFADLCDTEPRSPWIWPRQQNHLLCTVVFVSLFTFLLPAGRPAQTAEDICCKTCLYFITAASKTSVVLELNSPEFQRQINGENNEILWHCPRGQPQDGLIYLCWFCEQCEEKLHPLVIFMKAFFWQKIRATWGQELESSTSTAICSARWFQLFDRVQLPPEVKMVLFFNPFDNLVCILLGISFTVWFTLLLVFIIVPAIFGVSFGIRRLYMKTLLKIFEVCEF